ncbi:AK9, partial [Symbiodinium sp. KB8]
AAAEAALLFPAGEASQEAAEALVEAFDEEEEAEVESEVLDAAAVAADFSELALPPVLAARRLRRGWHPDAVGSWAFTTGTGQVLPLPVDVPTGRDGGRPGPLLQHTPESALRRAAVRAAPFYAADGRSLVHGPRDVATWGAMAPLQPENGVLSHVAALKAWRAAEGDLVRTLVRQVGPPRLSGAWGLYCPVSWLSSRKLVNGLGSANIQAGAVEFQGQVFVCAGAEAAACFVADPVRYLRGYAAPPVKDLPIRIPLHAMPSAESIAQSDVAAMGGVAEVLRSRQDTDPRLLARSVEAQRCLALGGLCPVDMHRAWLEGSSFAGVRHGLRAQAALYKGRIFQCSSEEALRSFMSAPHTFSHLSAPFNMPPPPQLRAHRLPASFLLAAAAAGHLPAGTMGFLSAAVAPLVQRALAALAGELSHLKHPKLSVQATSMRFISLYLSAYNPMARPHRRARGRAALQEFLQACKLPLAWKAAATEAGVTEDSCEARQPPPPAAFQVGQQVDALHARRGEWLPAVVERVEGPMFGRYSFRVRFSDGDLGTSLAEESLRTPAGFDALAESHDVVFVSEEVSLPTPDMPTYSLGDTVKALYKGRGRSWFKATVTAVQMRARRPVYTVRYADGEEHTLQHDCLRTARKLPSGASNSAQSSKPSPAVRVQGDTSTPAVSVRSRTAGGQQSMPPGGEAPVSHRIRRKAKGTAFLLPKRPAKTRGWGEAPAPTPPRAPPGPLLTGASPLPSSIISIAAPFLVHEADTGGSRAEQVSAQRAAVAKCVLSQRRRAVDDVIDVLGFEVDKVLGGAGADPCLAGRDSPPAIEAHESKR